MANQVVLPGDEIRLEDEDMNKGSTRLGFGVFRKGGNIVATKGGKLVEYEEKNSKKYYVESYQMRYIPVVNDSVIGVIVDKQGDEYRVDIGAPQLCNLSIYAFEGATKRNRPMLSSGSTVYGRVISSETYLDPEIACMLEYGKSGGYGELSGGYLIRRCSLSLCRRLLSEELGFFNSFGKTVPYEVAVGMNGRIWIKSESRKNSILIANAVLKSEFLGIDEVKNLAEIVANRLSE